MKPSRNSNKVADCTGVVPPSVTPMSHRDLEALRPFLVERRFEARRYVVRHAEAGGALFIMLSGVVEVSRGKEAGRRVVIARRYKGEVIGEISAVTGASRSADVRTLTACVLGELSGGHLEEVFRKVPSFAIHLLRLLAGRLAESTQQSVNFATCDIPTLVLKALQSLSVARYMTTGKVLVVHPRPTHEELAQMVGSSREVVTRAMKLLEKTGEIKFDGEQLLVRC